MSSLLSTTDLIADQQQMCPVSITITITILYTIYYNYFIQTQKHTKQTVCFTSLWLVNSKCCVPGNDNSSIFRAE